MLLRDETDGETASRGLCQLQYILGAYHLLGNYVSLWIGLIVRILRISVDGAVVLLSFVQEVELDGVSCGRSRRICHR